jgi:hypothetical protein
MFFGLNDYINYYKTYRFIYNLGTPYIIVFLSFLIIEWVGREQKYALEKLGIKWKRYLRFSMYYLIIITIFFFTLKKDISFIYFQF